MNRQKSFANQESGILYLVPTPIGNMQEITPRAVQILEEADCIACEDTRNSGLLLKNLGIKKSLISHHEHNQEQSIPRILDLLEQGKKVAVISDAGYPVISDPGSYLVSEAIENGFSVVSVSGANAALNALVASGLDARHYLYYGFLDAKSSRRCRQLEELKSFPYTLIFYEAPHRIEATLKDLREVLGERKVCLAREITKIHEEYLRGTVSEVLEACSSLKGEMVLVVEGAALPAESSSLEQALELVDRKIEEGLKPRAAAAFAAKETGFSKNELYQKYLEIKE